MKKSQQAIRTVRKLGLRRETILLLARDQLTLATGVEVDPLSLLISCGPITTCNESS